MDTTVHEDRTAKLPSPEDVAFFAENGYWISPQFMSQERLEECRKALDRVYAGEYLSGRPPITSSVPGSSSASLGKVDNAWWSDPVLADLATDAYIGGCAAALLSVPAIRLWQDQLLYKPGGGSAQGTVGWHQDWQYWQGAAEAPDLLTAWVAFDDVDDANGAMQVIPGSHRLGLVEDGDFFESDRDSQTARLGIEQQAPASLVMKAGQMSFHHCLTLHGSGPNTTDRPRRSLAVHLMRADLRSARSADIPVHYNVDLLEQQGGHPGDPYTGPLWPLIHPNDGAGSEGRGRGTSGNR